MNNKRPAGYVYRPYPKMIYNAAWKPLGYKIVKDEAEHQEALKSVLVTVPEPVKEVKAKKKLKFDME